MKRPRVTWAQGRFLRDVTKLIGWDPFVFFGAFGAAGFLPDFGAFDLDVDGFGSVGVIARPSGIVF